MKLLIDLSQKLEIGFFSVDDSNYSDSENISALFIKVPLLFIALAMQCLLPMVSRQQQIIETTHFASD